MAYADRELGKAKDRERFRRRVEARLAAGLCTRCGRHAPATGRKICEGCAEKKRVAGRVRDARLRAAGLPRRDPVKAAEYERKRSRRRAAERRAQGVCTQCGRVPAAPNRRQCEPCLVKRREADRVRYQKARAAGLPYGGKDPKAKRASARVASQKRYRARVTAGQCTHCGRRPPVEGGTTCARCRVSRRESDRATYTARRSAGLCVRCAGPTTDGGSRCAPCAVGEYERRDLERKNENSRRRYRTRRAASRCTDCNSPSHGAARCEPCARRSYERSDHFRGMPVWQPTYTVIELPTGRCHGPFDTEAEAAASLVFEELSFEQVEIVTDAPVTASLTNWT